MARRSASIGLFVVALAAAAGAADPPGVAIAARAVQPGEVLVIDLTPGQSADAITLRVFNHDIAAFKIEQSSTWRALVGVDLAVVPGRYRIVITSRASGTTTHGDAFVTVGPHSFPTRRLQVEPAFVNPPEDVQERIAREAQDLERVWTESSRERLWTGPFVPPVPGPANSAFGSRSVFNGQPRSPHTGGDFLSPAGTPVEAPNAGRVVMARELYFTGNVVVIDHGMGLFSLLAHLSRIDVHEGDVVAAGQQVGLVGATGRVTGPHLHWAVRVAGARVDPLSLLAAVGRDAHPPIVPQTAPPVRPRN
jgi:murein DD-endopeptidase MepM/ murein hydrolase activator NlpD